MFSQQSSKCYPTILFKKLLSKKEKYVTIQSTESKILKPQIQLLIKHDNKHLPCRSLWRDNESWVDSAVLRCGSQLCCGLASSFTWNKTIISLNSVESFDKIIWMKAAKKDRMTISDQIQLPGVYVWELFILFQVKLSTIAETYRNSISTWSYNELP